MRTLISGELLNWIKASMSILPCCVLLNRRQNSSWQQIQKTFTTKALGRKTVQVNISAEEQLQRSDVEIGNVHEPIILKPTDLMKQSVQSNEMFHKVLKTALSNDRSRATIFRRSRTSSSCQLCPQCSYASHRPPLPAARHEEFRVSTSPQESRSPL